jgi:DNA mismatch repair ATPase MutL
LEIIAHPVLVDINLRANKSEVKLVKEKEICGFLKEILSHILNKSVKIK